MSKFKQTMETEVIVTFPNEELSKQFFLSEDFAAAFWGLEDLREVAAALSEAFMLTETHWNRQRECRTKYLGDAFGTFISRDNEWHLVPELALYSGDIIIEATELEIYFSEEL